MDLHPSEKVIYSGHPSWRSTLLFYVEGLVLAVVVGVIVWFAKDDKHGIAVAVLVVIVALTVLVGYIRRLSTHYVVTNERLHIRRGIIARHVQDTRLVRVQNVNTDQSAFERLLSIGTVDFDTAGTDDSDFKFEGLAGPAKVAQAVDQAMRELTQPQGAASPTVQEPAAPAEAPPADPQ